MAEAVILYIDGATPRIMIGEIIQTISLAASTALTGYQKVIQVKGILYYLIMRVMKQ